MDLFLDFLFPMYANYKVNSTMKNKLLQIEADEGIRKEFGILDNVEDGNSVDKSVLESLNKAEIERKKVLEDKAKTNVIGITIAISLIMGAYGLCNSVYSKYPNFSIHWLVFAVFSISVFYMICAGTLSISTIINENQVYCPFNNGVGSVDDVLKKDLDKCIGQNRIQNIIRNNNVYTTYECIRNALLCLFLVLIISTVPVEGFKQETNTVSVHQEIYYSSEVAKYLVTYDVENEVLTDVFQFVKAQKPVIENGEYGFVDESNSYFIKILLEGDRVNVIMVEPIAKVD